MKKILIGLVLVLLTVTIIFVLSNNKQEPKYKTENIIRGNIIETVTASGTINPVSTTSVGTQTSGMMKNIYVDFNSPVKKGQVIAQIDPTISQLQVEQNQANVLNAKANFQKVKSLMLNDLKTYNRAKTLYERNFISKSDVDLAEANYNANKAQLMSAQAQISQVSVGLRNSQTLLSFTKVLSPVDGVVVSRNVDIGQTVAASFQTPTLFVIAKDLTKMQIDTNVAEVDIGKIKAGQYVEYTLDSYPGMNFKGKVKQVRIAPITVQNVVTYNVVINVDNKDLKLKPGMTANVSIITNNKKNILTVPNSSLRFTPVKTDDVPRYKEQGIWILADKKPKRINIKTGVSDGTFTEISSSRINEGQKVIIYAIEKDNNSRKGSGSLGMRPL